MAYETVSDVVLIDLVKRYPRFETFATVMEDFSQANHTLLAKGTHPAQSMTPVGERAREAVLALVRHGDDLQREYQSAVDAKNAADRARHFAAARRDWLREFDVFIKDLHASGESRQAQRYIEQQVAVLVASIKAIPE